MSLFPALALSLLACQEPEAAPGPSQPYQELLREIDRLATVVREGFAKVDTGLREARDQVRPETPQTEPFLARLDLAHADAGQLLQDLEALLALLPEEPKDPPPESGGGGPSSQKPGEERNRDAAEPRDGKESPADEAENAGAKAPPPSSYLRLLFDQGAGAWGVLPPRLQEALQNAVIEDLPLRYRRWLDEFHRR